MSARNAATVSSRSADVVEAGLGLRKVDFFLTDADGDRIAVLAQAPASEFAKHARLFDLLRTSLVPRA